MMEVLSPEQEEFTFDVPDQEPRESKFFYAAGKYRARCVDLEMGTTKPKEGQTQGDPKVVLSYTLLEGPGEGVEMKQHLPVTKKMFWKLEEAAKALGVTYDAATKKISFKKSECIGKDVTLELVQSQFNGRDRMEIKKVLKAEGTSPF